MIWTSKPAELIQILNEGDLPAFSSYLAQDQRVEVDLRPLMATHGILSDQQTALAYSRFTAEYRLSETRLLSEQGDANYAWIELNVELHVTHRIRGDAFRLNCVFQFKIRTDGVAMSQWKIQDIQ